MNCFAKFLAARLRSFGFALEGLVYAVKTEGNARVHLVATLLVIALGFGFGVSRGEWMALLAAMGLVWTAELLNTALEILCDIVEPERSEAIKRAKDVAAAGVLASALAAAGIGALVFWPYIFG
ncbi:MAG: diacylglycerol kinase family protein [Rhodobacteraceae bacterium]|nr:diacylglycerol kinase family protein [Paracoccaceae bacterium]